mmetsp:Transcript_34353/g.88807  ORF Transcript_34353/g.88807 Transcript_34353/m.88807 type:complete len:269 (+) Transcript_34353:1057-1863(+)
MKCAKWTARMVAFALMSRSASARKTSGLGLLARNLYAVLLGARMEEAVLPPASATALQASSEPSVKGLSATPSASMVRCASAPITVVASQVGEELDACSLYANPDVRMADVAWLLPLSSVPAQRALRVSSVNTPFATPRVQKMLSAAHPTCARARRAGQVPTARLPFVKRSVVASRSASVQTSAPAQKGILERSATSLFALVVVRMMEFALHLISAHAKKDGVGKSALLLSARTSASTTVTASVLMSVHADGDTVAMIALRHSARSPV